MTDQEPVRLGEVQQTLFIPLMDRVRESRRPDPLVRDPTAVRIAEQVEIDPRYVRNTGGVITVVRTCLFDRWVREFVTEHPGGTVVELGTGLNTRFERVDNGQVHWLDLDLPDTIALRRRFFADTDRRRMVAASLLDEQWLDEVAALPGPYFFVTEGVLVYLPGDGVHATLRRIATRFPDSLVALDTYRRSTMQLQNKSAASGRMDARWQWACDDPRSLESLGLRLVDSARVTRPPKQMRAKLPLRYRIGLPLADRPLRGLFNLSLFRTTS
jgi:O-methyltransferase involved in polyketide biosynthesis